MTPNKLEIISTQNQIEKNFKDFFEKIKINDIILLQGPIGAGKTSLVNAFIHFKNPEAISGSPSYSLVNEYVLSDFKVQHIDLYRVEDEEDLESTGFWDVMAEPNSVFFIEWPERMDINDLPKSKLYQIEISLESETHRKYIISKK